MAYMDEKFTIDKFRVVAEFVNEVIERILMTNNANDLPKMVWTEENTFGTVSASYLAVRALKQLSMDEESILILRDNFYMEDVLGIINFGICQELQYQLWRIFQESGNKLQ
ncbi:hypothetical protein CEXT_543561 [Caerostris extrusa]|uniref:Uncharacterized protein n=1 Tax=Caerostris extrusa TaxID=172846 RepID=A0AAV4NQB8_CAEEX|nr:hypothetical protein CEXT_543561 [Caerostris extrusa]